MPRQRRAPAPPRRPSAWEEWSARFCALVTHPRAPLLTLALAVLLGCVVLCARLASTAAPGLSRLSLSPTSEELQAVCITQGHLQLLAKYNGDPITAFELLNLDPTSPPFASPQHSNWPEQEWYHKLRQTVDHRYTELMAVVTDHDRDPTGHNDADNDRYKAALTAASNILANPGPRNFYLEVVLPELDLVLRGRARESWCVWRRVRAYHRHLCAATWPTTGMLELLREDSGSVWARLDAAADDCFDVPLFPASNGVGR